jgi:hypothetical protein
MIFFLPETAFPRHLLLVASPDADDSSSITPHPFRFHTIQAPFLSLRPIKGLPQPSLHSTTLRFLRLHSFPNIALPVIFYCWTWYLFILCVITMFPAAYPTYTPQIQGLLFLGFIIGTLIAEFFASGALSDRLVRRLTRDERKARTPEMRLPLYAPAALLTCIGLLLFGISVQRGWHWATGQFAVALFAFGIQVGNTMTAVYAVDCYPEPKYAMDVITFYSFHLNLSAFVAPFFIIPWINR